MRHLPSSACLQETDAAWLKFPGPWEPLFQGFLETETVRREADLPAGLARTGHPGSQSVQAPPAASSQSGEWVRSAVPPRGVA